MKKAIFLLLAAGLIAAGCSNTNADPHAEHAHVHVQEEPATAPGPADNPIAEDTSSSSVQAEQPEETKYTLSATVNDQYELLIDTNLTFSIENYNLSHQEGEGHVHLYVNGRLIGPLRENKPHPVANYLKDGENTIKLALASNNHDESKYKTRYEFTVNYEGGEEEAQ